MAKLNAKDLKGFKVVLLALRMRLTNGIGKIKDDTLKQSARESSGDLSGYSFHMADQATDNYDRDFMLSLASNEQATLYKIDEALKRIDEKTFGVCSECSKQITKIRLKAMPFSEYCVPCQEMEEQQKKS